jgi:hypothetical protein
MSAKVSLNKIRVPSRTKLTPRYRTAAKEAFKRALDAQYGSLGPASPVRRIDPKTGHIIPLPADDIRLLLGPKVAARL